MWRISCVHPYPLLTPLPLPAPADTSNYSGHAALVPTLSCCLTPQPGGGLNLFCMNFSVWRQKVLLLFIALAVVLSALVSNLDCSIESHGASSQTHPAVCPGVATLGTSCQDALSKRLLAFSDLLLDSLFFPHTLLRIHQHSKLVRWCILN